VDRESGEVIRWFHPRRDVWSEHFELEGAGIVGRTPIGRATVDALSMNADDVVLIGVELQKEGTL
jgi:hypothetical protein